MFAFGTSICSATCFVNLALSACGSAAKPIWIIMNTSATMKKPIAARSALKQPAAKRPVEKVMKKTSAARLSGKPLKNLVVGALVLRKG